MSSVFREVSGALWLAGICLAGMVVAGTSMGAHPTLAQPAQGEAAAASSASGLLTPGILRVTAEPNNLPFSNDRGQGFENKIAELVARDLGVKLEYAWRAQRRGYIRETIKAGEADLVIGVPTGLDMTLNSKPYYRSAYAFVYRKRGGPAIKTLDDPRLRTVKVGVPLTGDSNPPPVQALSARGIVNNVVGYSVFGDYALPNPTAGAIEAVANKEVEVAIVWGPVAGYLADRLSEPLAVVPIVNEGPEEREAGQHFAFNMSMGMRRGNKVLKGRIDAILVKRREEIERILNEYHVPLLAIEQANAGVNEISSSAKRTAKASAKPCDCD